MTPLFVGIFITDQRQRLATLKAILKVLECRPCVGRLLEILAILLAELDGFPGGVVCAFFAESLQFHLVFGLTNRLEQVCRRPEFGIVLVDRGVKPRGRPANDADQRCVRGHVGQIVLKGGNVGVRDRPAFGTGLDSHTCCDGRPAFIYAAGANHRPSISMPGDSEDPNADVQYHLEVGPDDVANTVLLPGNPERLEKIVAHWDDHELRAHHREYRTATGTYEGTPISVTSTGIGGPSAAIALEELARVDCETFIRVGSCGAIQPEMDVGDLVITTGAVRQEGTSDEYVREDYPAAADYEVVSALVAAAERLGYDYHTGITMSADSFYPGQATRIRRVRSRRCGRSR